MKKRPAFILAISLILSCQSLAAGIADPPDLLMDGYVTRADVETESGPVSFLGNQFAFERSNYGKIFAKSAFNNTLHSDKRREDCYSHSLMVASQLPVMINSENSEGINRILKNLEKFASYSGTTVNLLDHRKNNYVKAEDLEKITRNFISKYLRKVNPKSHSGVKINTTNLNHLSSALKVLKGITISVDFAYNAAIREALVTGEALTRISLIEETLKKRRAAGLFVDPVLILAVADAKKKMTASEDYFGALLVEMSERRDELVQMGLSAGLNYVKKHYAQHALTNFYAHHSAAHATSSAIAAKSATVAGLWSMSLMLTYVTIKGLVEQHEKVQMGITSTTLSTLLKEELNAGRLEHSQNVDAMIWHLEYLYYDQMVEIFQGIMPAFKDFVDNIIFREKYNKAWNEYFSDLEQQSQLALEGLDLFDYPDMLIENKDNVSIGFIIDSSSSMEDSDPDNIRITALIQIIKQLEGDENVFIVDFDSYAEWKTSDIWSNWDGPQLEEKVNSIDSRGNTDIGLGLQTMSDALDGCVTDFSNTAVILLSDGVGSYSDQVEWYVENGVEVYTVSYKDNADAKLLSDIAIASGGLYIQADDEHDVIAAFMQFFDDMQGNSKFLSYRGSFMGKSEISAPPFYVDQSTSDLTCNMTWEGTPKTFTIVSPDGNKYTNDPQYVLQGKDLKLDLISSQGPSGNGSAPSFAMVSANESITWTEGENFRMFRIKNPPPGNWMVKMRTVDGMASDDDFIIESSGNTPVNIELLEEKGGPGYTFTLKDDLDQLNWTTSEARVSLSTPERENIDISDLYRDGSFSFYPRDGEGNYSFDLTARVVSLEGDTLQRQYNRSVYIGEILPGYIAQVKELMGGYLRTDQGRYTGNRPGIKCLIYSPDSSKDHPKGSGYVTDVNDTECTIRITELMTGEIAVGDIVELDIIQWQNDN